MSNNLWNRVADFFKEWDGEDMTKSMLLYVDELREINSNRIELIRLERERKEIRDKAIEEFAEEIKATLPITVHRDCSEIDYEVDYALYGLRSRIDRIAEQMKEVGK